MKLENLIKSAETIKDKSKIKHTQRKVKIKRYEELGIEDPYITVQRPSTLQMISIAEHKNEAFSLSLAIVDPDLNDKELQKAYGVNNAKALVGKLFTDEEQSEITTVVGEMIQNKSRIQIVDEIKN